MKIETKIIDVDSSLINKFEYIWSSEDPWTLNNEGHLRVTFQNGFRYIYENVPFITLMSIAADESIGEAFNRLIKNGNYKYYKD